MTVREMQQDAMRRISHLGDGDVETMQSIWLFVSSALPAHKEENITESERAKAKRLAHSFLGAFSASRTDEDWKKVKEDYLVSKYAPMNRVFAQ